MIPIVREPEDLQVETEVYENCCFCYKPTPFWYMKKDVAVCPECAKVHKVSEVPKKIDWYKAMIGYFEDMR